MMSVQAIYIWGLMCANHGTCSTYEYFELEFEHATIILHLFLQQIWRVMQINLHILAYV